MNIELGIVEGYYGRAWSWREREEGMTELARFGYRFWMYGPKADPYLRRRWREPHPRDDADSLLRFSRRCQEVGVRFGVGLSPYESYLRFDGATRRSLADRLAFFDDLGVLDLAILFDDMRGDVADLADRQAEIVHWAAARSAAGRVLVCPTYYSDDPILDHAFGPRPPEYLERLGQQLDPSVEVFWTGEEICSREFTPGHLRHVARRLGRKPFLWDNYPVNDGQRMSRHLHLRAFTGRPAAIGDWIAAHGINPALQPVLSRVPALTLPECYRLGEDYRYGEALREAARTVLGEPLAAMVRHDLLALQDVGLDRLGERTEALRERYRAVDHDGAREIVAWLDGDYGITDEVVRTQ